MLSAATEAGDDVQIGRGALQISVVTFQAHQFEEALAYAERAHHLAQENCDRETLGGSLGTMAFVHAVTGDLAGAQPLADAAVAAARQSSSPMALGFALHVSGHLAEWTGEHDRSLSYWDEGLQLGQAHQIPAMLQRALWTQGLGRCGRGDYQAAIHCLLEGIALAARLGDRIWGARDLNTLGWVYTDLCNWDLAIQYNARGVEAARVLGDPEIIRYAELNLADCYLAVGRLDDAQRLLESVERESRRRGAWGEEWMKWRYTQHLHASLGDMWIARGDPEKALSEAETCLTAAETTHSRRNIVKARRVSAEAFMVQGRLTDAESEIERALAVAREDGNPPSSGRR